MSFRDCKIIGSSVNPSDYFESTGARGTPDFSVSSSALRLFAQCPARFIAGYELPDSDAKLWGRVRDCAHLTPDQWGDRVAVHPETYTNKKGTESFWKRDRRIPEIADWLDENEHREIISPEDADRIEAAEAVLTADPSVAAWRAACDTQVWVSGFYALHGLVIPVKCLIDYAPRVENAEFARYLGDLKMTRSAEPMHWKRFLFHTGYHIQAAWNLDLFNAATGEKRDAFRFVLQETFDPWQVGRRVLKEAFLAMGRRQYRAIVAAYVACLTTGKWPDYEDGETEAGWGVVRPEPYMEMEVGSKLPLIEDEDLDQTTK